MEEITEIMCFKEAKKKWVAAEDRHIHLSFFFFSLSRVSLCHWLEYNGMISAPATSATDFKRLSCLELLSSWDYRCAPPRSLIFMFLVETGFHVSGWSRKLPTSRDPPASHTYFLSNYLIMILRSCFCIMHGKKNTFEKIIS